LNGSIEYKDIQNFIAGSRLTNGSRVLSVGNFGLNRRGSFAGGSYSLNAGVSFGLDAFGALKDNNVTQNQPHAQFWLADFDVSYNRPLPVGNRQLSWTSNLKGQWSPHALYSSEQFFIGGEGSVRGYRNGSLGGDIGVTWSNSLGYVLPIDLSDTPFRAVELTGGIDFGHIEKNYADATQEGNLVGAQLGIRSRGGPLYFEVTWNKGLDAPNGFQADDDFVLFKVGGRF
jgi:hemolysin activation/secretion protein